jgi:hypothetical protein
MIYRADALGNECHRHTAMSRLRLPSRNDEYSSVNAPWTYFFSPAGPDRSVVSSNPPPRTR